MSDPPSRSRLQRQALRLEYVTIGWNVSESAISIALGVVAGSLALIGFGADSLIEVFASVVVVWHLAPGHATDHPERTGRALRLVGWAFAVLSVVLAAAAIRDLATVRRPDASPWGIAYIGVTALVMFGLGFAKKRTADRLDSSPLRSEATMSLLDGVLALSTMIGLAANAAFGWWWADPGAALIVAVAAANEARENWEEAAELT